MYNNISVDKKYERMRKEIQFYLFNNCNIQNVHLTTAHKTINKRVLSSIIKLISITVCFSLQNNSCFAVS